MGGSRGGCQRVLPRERITISCEARTTRSNLCKTTSRNSRRSIWGISVALQYLFQGWSVRGNGKYKDLLMDTGVEELAYIEGRLQAVRLYEATNDSGVKDMLSRLIARDTMLQNQWLAAIKELEAKENIVIPSRFPRNLEKREVSHVLFNYSEGNESATGRWANGPSVDGEGQFQYVENPVAYGNKTKLKPAPLYIHNTLHYLLKNHTGKIPLNMC